MVVNFFATHLIPPYTTPTSTMSSSSGEESVGMISSSDDDSDNETSSSSSSKQQQRKKKRAPSFDDDEVLSDASDSSTSSTGSNNDFTSLLDKATAKVRVTIKEKNERKAAQIAKDFRDNKAKKETPVKKSSVIYIGHVPHGFYEDQMRGFLSQFGTVTRLRLSRNKKTGRSKHYAFVEFEARSVAKIVAAAMNGYFLAGRRLVCHVVKKDNVHEKMFAGSNRKFRPIPWRMIEKQRHNAPRSEAQQKKVVSGLLSREKRKREKLKELGIDYDFPGYSAAIGKSETTKGVEEEEESSTKSKKKKQKKTKK